MRKLFLIFVVGLLWTAAGCGPDDKPIKERFPSRVTEKSASAKQMGAGQWCDIYNLADPKKKLKLPNVVDLAGTQVTKFPQKGRWTWVNFWATWCGPCLKEFPFVERFARQLEREGLPVDVVFVSLDDDKEALETFMKTGAKRPYLDTLRVVEPDTIGKWFETLGLEPETAIPVNVMAAPDGTVRCVRTGSFAEGDFAVVERVFDPKAKY